MRVDTDLTVSGKVAQFGRGVLADVSSKLLNQFVACLEADVLAGNPGAAGTPRPGGDELEAEERAPAAPSPEVRRIESRPSEPVDLLETAGAPMAKRVAPLVAVVFLMAWLFRRRRRSRRSRG